MKTEKEIRDKIALLEKLLNIHIALTKNPRDESQKEVYEALVKQKRIAIMHLKWVLDDIS